MIKVNECKSLAAFEKLRGEWNEFLEKADCASVFATWEWIEAFWKNDMPGGRPFVLEARDDEGRLVGLLPLTRTNRLGIMPVIQVAGCSSSGYPVGDYGGPVAARGLESAVWRALLAHLKQRRWVIIDLRNCQTGPVGREEQLTHIYEASASECGWTVRVEKADPCRLIPLPEDFETYLATLSANARQNLRRKLRKFHEARHTVEQVDAEDEAARNEALEALFRLHQQRWADDPSGGSFPNEQVRSLHRYLASSLAAAGMVDLRVARAAGGEIIGVIYNFRRNGVGYFYILGTSQDPKCAGLSLGVCLLADSIRAAMEAGCHTFDLLRGDHHYKSHFGGHIVYNLRVTMYRQNWLPKASVLATSVRASLRTRIGSQVKSRLVSE